MSGYVVGAGNRVTGDGTWTYTHDDTGAVTGKSKSGEAWAYTYDLNGQLTSASKSATVGGTVTDSVVYTYDAWGNRVSRVQTGTTSSTERYVVDGWDTAKGGAAGTENFDTTIDLNSSNAVTGRRVFGAGFDAAVARRDAGGAVSWYGADGLGSVRQVFDNSGGVTGSRTFDGFGNATASSGTGLDRYGYTGTVTDPLTGLVGDNARVYDPATGRWYSPDPDGFAAGDANLYRYVGNNATGGRDPSGMDKWYYDPHDPNANSNVRVVPKPERDPLKERIAKLRAQVVPKPISQMNRDRMNEELANEFEKVGLRAKLRELEGRLQVRDEVAVQKVVEGVVAINVYYRKNQGVPLEMDLDFAANRALGEEYEAQQGLRRSAELQTRIANYRNAPVPELRRPDGVPEFVWGIANNSYVRHGRAFAHYLDHGNPEKALVHLVGAVGSVLVEGAEWWVGGKVINYGVQGVRALRSVRTTAPRGSQPTARPAKLPASSDDLTKLHGYNDISHEKAAALGYHRFKNPATGDVVEFHRGKPGATGFEGIDHYHRFNPDATGSGNLYLDKFGKPRAKNSRDSHIIPGE